MRVDATSYAETADAVVDLVTAGGGGTVCVATVHMVMEAFDDPAFQRLVNAAERVTPDGVPLVWALRLLGIPGAKRVYGPTLTPIVCARAELLGIPVGFYGGSQQVLDALLWRLRKRFPRLEVAFAHSPPFRALSDEEDRRMTEAIDASGARILFVGLGCPKQERWMASHRETLSCVMLGVGAAFDFLAGAKPQSPPWMQRAGLEWLFRLCVEPRRLWRRYLIHNPRFLFRFALELARRSVASRRREGVPGIRG
jgi:N-acetylglucosaminyldiphosphoundecaprenol N-acetyl-beta-D-mannosaminyltransferase